jgi:two-component system, response regulator
LPDGSRILIVEDSQSDLELTLHALRIDPVATRVDVARDGVEALEYIFCAGRYQDRSPLDGPDLILLDLKLPLVDGFEVLRAVRADARTASLPITVLSASGDERDVVESYRLGANSYVVKPDGFGQLATALQLLSAYWLRLNKPARRALA